MKKKYVKLKMRNGKYESVLKLADVSLFIIFKAYEHGKRGTEGEGI